MAPRRPLFAALLGLAAAGLSGGSSYAMKLGGGADAEVSAWRVVAAFLFCAGLAIAVAFLLRTRIKGTTALFSQAPRRLQLLETTRVSHQTDICLMSCDGQDFLVAVSPNGVTFHPGLAPAKTTRKAKGQPAEGAPQ